jgi:hypothetical protein
MGFPRGGWANGLGLAVQVDADVGHILKFPAVYPSDRLRRNRGRGWAQTRNNAIIYSYVDFYPAHPRVSAVAVAVRRTHILGGKEEPRSPASGFPMAVG